MANTSTDDERDAIDMLMEDHKRVHKLFKQFEGIDRTDHDALTELVEIACVELQIHSMLEEELFYPAVRAHTREHDEDSQDLLNEAEVEHESIEELIGKLQELEADDAMYCAYFSVLSEYVKHHVREEEKELFPKVKKMPALDLRQLAEDMRLRREELFAEIEESDEELEDESSVSETDDAVAAEIDPEDESEDAHEQIDISRTRH